jgi:hypothetical protein
MAKIRAYRLAKELGMERAEFVEKASAAGVELRSTMASLDEADAEKLRRKLGGVKKRGETTEKRVERSGVATVIRRRKKKEEPPPEPVIAEPVPEPVIAEPVPEPAIGEPVPEPAIGEPVPEPAIGEPRRRACRNRGRSRSPRRRGRTPGRLARPGPIARGSSASGCARW